MKECKTGRNGDFCWIEFPGNTVTLAGLLHHYSHIARNKYLAIVCFDGGILTLASEELNAGWYEKAAIAYSPKLTDGIISTLPTEQHDQWCLFNAQTEFPGMTDFVNYSGFTLTSEREDQLTAQFWKEVAAINPAIVIIDGDNFVFLSKEINDIETLKKNTDFGYY